MHHDLISKRIAVIGAGFCGTVLAANLLRREPRPRAGHWEATAVAELRAHAEALADTLAEADA